MQAQKMTHAHIAVPPDCLGLLTELVTKLGGQVMSESSADSIPSLERGGKMLKELRQRAGLTQKQVADALGIPQSHISEFERDRRNIPCKHAQTLATLFHAVPSYFMRPNDETLEAMDELGAGKGVRSGTKEELFENLGYEPVESSRFRKDVNKMKKCGKGIV
jgi:transcriptional regulator with XRE-family HTH domain